MLNANILIVDDDDQARQALAEYIGMLGHQAMVAGSADEAIAAVKAARFHLILLDLVLPGRTGLQVLGELKSLARAPIYLMSGQNDGETRKDALLLGATGFFGKPLNLEALKLTLNDLKA